ncbi:DNA polymerase III subunit chi [Paracoccus aminophilus]|uniref:DNA polymerase III, subunit chi n=1 Tax=Paracoccus aminophilus JCM 7686 TaxID=1367847 RepID=S5YRF2_PARAH|nr:DNA polymerase III subunit chi [Paracoccus aminophilus]AGT07846.1 DNA polymerase III, subunit chi [Paracoccus aminophilus JCM 7686]
MGAALFYHLTRSAPEVLLPVLIGKSLHAGWRVELRGAHLPALERLDESLWLGDGFLPHGLAGGPHDSLQPVLLTLVGQGATNNPSCLITLHGAEVAAEDCAPLERTLILFDGNDPEALERARAQWRLLTKAGVSAEYWSEASGKWERKQ